MAKIAIKKDSTSVTLQVFIQDSASTTGAGKTGLVFNSAGLTAYYARPRAAAVAITLATQTVTGAFSSGGFVEIDATNMPGWYRLDLPDAALATGVSHVGVHLKGASGMAPLPLEIQLTNFDPDDGVRAGLTALPNAAAAANGGLPTIDANNAVKVQSGTGANQISLAAGLVTVGTMAPDTVTASALATDAGTEIADAVLARVLAAESYAADGAAPTLSQILYMLWSAIGDFSIAGTTITCKRLDGTTTSMTFTLNDGTNPTSRTRAT